MTTSTNPLISPWHPIDNKVDLKHLGKLNEELGELSSAVARCIIQGVDESEPVTGRKNRDWIEDEIADVLANITLNIHRFQLNETAIGIRVAEKIAHLRKWHVQA